MSCRAEDLGLPGVSRQCTLEVDSLRYCIIQSILLAWEDLSLQEVRKWLAVGASKLWVQKWLRKAI